MARTVEFVLHFVRCVTVTVSPNQIMIIITHISMYPQVGLEVPYILKSGYNLEIVLNLVKIMIFYFVKCYEIWYYTTA